MDRHEGSRPRFSGSENSLVRPGRKAGDSSLLALGQGALPRRWGEPRVGLARDPRISRGKASAALAGRSCRAGGGALGVRGNACRVSEAARAHEHERAQALSRQGENAGSACRNRAGRGDLVEVQAAVPVRSVRRCGRDVRAGGAALQDLRGRAAAGVPRLRRCRARAARDARVDRSGAARDRGHSAVRHGRVKTYVVGGAVRDELLGLPVKDRDHVVVGATPEEMVRLGFKPVGRDFPVFLHPATHEEHALARTERKSGRGYKGFTVHAAPEVTLEDDLKRRDLTINAMAKADDGTLIDPFGGRRDLKEGVLRHVSQAFAGDPVRILRVARFAARFGFRVADETMQLMKAMVNSGEADSLVPERVWQEFSRGLAEPHPERMFEVLEACGLRQQLLPELKAVPKKLSGSVPERFKDLLEVAGLADPAVDVARLQRALEAATAVDAGAIAAKAGSQSEIPSLVDAARVHAIARAL